ncbi:MAG: SDR family oxidoreductase [Actinomycetota bacterium]|nr:SDR family oxidoreductase [Actinomycetota bacterium]
MDLHLRDKVIVITGGTDGLGAALAKGLLSEGARVAICGRDRERLARAQGELGAQRDRLLAIPADVTVADDMERLIGTVADQWQRIDGLVNNAGAASGNRVSDLSDEEWADDFDLKVVAAARLIRLATPHLRSSGGGSIINVLAIAARAAAASSLPSSASRAAGLALTKAASKELGADGIRVNAILIGIIKSNQWVRRASQTGAPIDELYAEMANRSGIPLGRVGELEEFADLGAYLLSDRSSYITGSALNLDGGMSSAI